MSVFSLKDAQQIRLDGVDIHTIKLDGVVIYSAERTGDISIDITDYSVDLNSTISVIYTTTGNLRPEDITVTYDDTKLSKDGNNFTVIGEGYTEIVYNVLGNPHTTIRVATSFEGGLDYNATMDFQTSGYTLPEFVTLNNTYTYGFTYGNYGNGSYGLISGNYHIAGYAWGYLKLDLSELDGSFYVKVTYSCQSESTNYDYGSIGLTTTASMPSSFNMVSKTGNDYGVNMDISTSTTYTSAGIYYLHFKYTKDGSVDTGYDRLCIHKVEIVYTPNGAVGDMTYPATRLLLPESIINQTNGTFTITPTLIPDNANEKINVSYDSSYLTKSGDTFTCKKMGNTNITYTTTHCNRSVSVNIEPVYISSITLNSTLSSTTNVEPGTSFTLTPTTVPSNHDDELICEYDTTYLSKSGNTFTILSSALGQTLNIYYYAANSGVSQVYTLTVSSTVYATAIYLNNNNSEYYNYINYNSSNKSFTITPTLIPSNSTETVSISYNTSQLSKSGNTYTLLSGACPSNPGQTTTVQITFSTSRCTKKAYIYVENMPSSYSWSISPNESPLIVGKTYTLTLSYQPSSLNMSSIMNSMASNTSANGYINSSYTTTSNSITFTPIKPGTIYFEYMGGMSAGIYYNATVAMSDLENTITLDFSSSTLPDYPSEITSASNTSYPFTLGTNSTLGGYGLLSTNTSSGSYGDIYFKIDASNLESGKKIYITENYRNYSSNSYQRIYGALTTTTTRPTTSNYYNNTYYFMTSSSAYSSDQQFYAIISSPGIYYLHTVSYRYSSSSSSYKSSIRSIKFSTDDLNMFSIEDKLIESITLSPSSLSLNPNNIPYAVSATITPSDATNKNLSWTCSDSNVYIGVGTPMTNATVNINDTSIAVNSTITVSATDDSGVSASLPVTFTPAENKLVQSITFDRQSLALDASVDPSGGAYPGYFELRATVSPSDATNKKLNWSANPDYLNIESYAENRDFIYGGIKSSYVSTAVSNGTITVTADDGSGVYASIPYTITPISSGGDSDDPLELVIATLSKYGNNDTIAYTYDNSNSSSYAYRLFSLPESVTNNDSIEFINFNKSYTSPLVAHVARHNSSFGNIEHSSVVDGLRLRAYYNSNYDSFIRLYFKPKRDITISFDIDLKIITSKYYANHNFTIYVKELATNNVVKTHELVIGHEATFEQTVSVNNVSLLSGIEYYLDLTMTKPYTTYNNSYKHEYTLKSITIKEV